VFRVTVITLCAVALGGCRERHPGEVLRGPANPSAWPGFAGSSSPVLVGHPIKPGDLTESELKYGIAPKRGPGVTYQDGIILMEHGDKAIRSFASNGMAWTFDGNAPQVSDIQVGKILFATGRCVGRVLVLQRDGDKVSVILGPIQLTDVIKEGNFAYDQPLDLNSLTTVVAPDFPGAADPATYPQAALNSPASSMREAPPVKRSVRYYIVSNDGKWTPMRTVSGAPERSLIPADFRPARRHGSNSALFQIPGGLPLDPTNLGSLTPAPIPDAKVPTVRFDQMQAWPCFDCGGIGLKIYQEKNGVKIWTSVVFHLNDPHIVFDASVRSNGTINANVQLFGGAGVTATFDAGNAQDVVANVHEVKLIPAEISVPIGGVFVPFSVRLSQSIDIDTAFSAKTSTLHGAGNVDIDGEISGSYDGRGWALSQPKVKLTQNLAALVTGVSMGITSVVFAIDQRLLVGIGGMGFATGPYVDLFTSMTALNQSKATWIPCAQGTFDMQLGAGIGYSMPKVVASVINAFLSLFHAKPVPPWGSIVNLPHRADLFNHRDQIPNGCAGK
jgi:hypothetical protein